MQRDSQVSTGGTPIKCEKHDLHHSASDGCFKCKAGSPAVAERTQAKSESERMVPRYPPPEAPPLPAAEAQSRQVKHMMAQRDIANQLKVLAGIDAPNSDRILEVCLDLAQFLMGKNRDYSDAALNPVRIMSTSDVAEQIRVRMDDKLSRLMRGQAGGEDAMKDLVGYWVLMEVAKKMSNGRDAND